MDVLYFAFFNDPASPLPEIREEEREILGILEPISKGRFDVKHDSFTSLDELVNKLTLYRDELVLVHFGGHAGISHILLENREAKAKGLAQLLGQCTKLQLFFPNGCSSAGMVDILIEKGVPVTIASHRPVDDSKAREFAVHFYRALSYDMPLQEAYLSAYAKTLAIDDTIQFHRTAGRPAEEKKDLPIWGLFNCPGKEDAFDWRLPKGIYSMPLPSYKPNEKIIDTLMQALAPHVDHISRMLREEEVGEKEYTSLKKRSPILAALPHPISEQLSWLMSGQMEGEEGIFYDKPGANRLRQIVRIFDISVELMAFIMLAQLWDELNNEKRHLKIPIEAKDNIQNFLFASPMEKGRLDLFILIRNLRRVFDENAIVYFVEELKDLQSEFQEGKPFYEASRFLEAHRHTWKKVGQEEAASLSILAEERLATVLSYLGFMARYTFASVRNIDLLKYHHFPKPVYKHSLVKLVLEPGVKMPGEEKKMMKKYFDSTSVIVVKDYDSETPTFLNLTPFILDQNAFEENAPSIKLYFLQRYVHEQDAYIFRHIYMPNDPVFSINDQKQFRVIKDQFDVFARLLFNRNMRDVI
jgi:hypothetical protein